MAKRSSNNLDTKTVQKDIALMRKGEAPTLEGWATKKNGSRKIADGGGLYIVFTRAGNARFIHEFEWAKKTAERWLPGEYPDTIKLAEARTIRDQDRTLLRQGVNPIHAIKAEARAAEEVPTFAQWAAANIQLAPKEKRGRATWLRQMTNSVTESITVGALADMPIDDIKRAHVKAVMEPIWESHPPTARTLLLRIKEVLDHRYVNTEQDDDRVNPAIFSKIEQALGVAWEHKVTNRAALAWQEVPAFLAKLAGRTQMSARLLELVIATGCRVNSICQARWGWVDFSWRRDPKTGEMVGRTLTIPAKYMKARRGCPAEPHVIPLSIAMVRILRSAIPVGGMQPDALIFPSGRNTPYHSKDVSRHLRALVGDEPTTHGFRRVLVNWGTSTTHRDRPEFDNDLMQVCLAHKIGNKVSQAYLDDRWLARRRIVMQEWSAFCLQQASAEVVRLPLAA